MITIGSHLSIAKGYAAMGRQAVKLHADTFAFFVRSPRGGELKALQEGDIPALQQILQEQHIGPLVAHAPYTCNPCAARADLREAALRIMRQDLARLQLLPGHFYNFHPGSHVGQGAERGIALTAELLNELITPDLQTTVLIETMAGKGSEIGRTFEEIAGILERLDHPDRVGVCLDTCHVWDAGYDIAGDLDGVLSHFDAVIGLERLRAVHLNDSKNPLGSRKDRHEKLGQGCIGREALLRVVTHPLLQGRPFILETPNDDAGYAREIALVREHRLP